MPPFSKPYQGDQVEACCRRLLQVAGPGVGSGDVVGCKTQYTTPASGGHQGRPQMYADKDTSIDKGLGKGITGKLAALSVLNIAGFP